MVVPLLLCCSGLRYRMFFALICLKSWPGWKPFHSLFRPSSFYAKFRLGSLKVSLGACLSGFHWGLLSMGPEESADGDHARHLRHHHNHHHWVWSSGWVGDQWDARPEIVMEGAAANQNPGGGGTKTHTTEKPTEGRNPQQSLRILELWNLGLAPSAVR